MKKFVIINLLYDREYPFNEHGDQSVVIKGVFLCFSKGTFYEYATSWTPGLTYALALII